MNINASQNSQNKKIKTTNCGSINKTDFVSFRNQ